VAQGSACLWPDPSGASKRKAFGGTSGGIVGCAGRFARLEPLAPCLTLPLGFVQVATQASLDLMAASVDPSDTTSTWLMNQRRDQPCFASGLAPSSPGLPTTPSFMFTTLCTSLGAPGTLNLHYFHFAVVD
jgi:hypothetical protein